jgi:hypothetical protein
MSRFFLDFFETLKFEFFEGLKIGSSEPMCQNDALTIPPTISALNEEDRTARKYHYRGYIEPHTQPRRPSIVLVGDPGQCC